jgi:hypothetical protein
MAKPKITTEGKPRKKRVQAKPPLSKVIREKQLKKLDEIKVLVLSVVAKDRLVLRRRN